MTQTKEKDFATKETNKRKSIIWKGMFTSLTLTKKDGLWLLQETNNDKDIPDIKTIYLNAYMIEKMMSIVSHSETPDEPLPSPDQKNSKNSLEIGKNRIINDNREVKQ
jgi:hypothetical protein